MCTPTFFNSDPPPPPPLSVRCADYGLAEDDPNLTPRGPKFTEQPSDVLLLEGLARVVVDCAVFSNPSSQYRMYRTRVSTGETTLVTSDLDPRSVTDV